MPKAPKFHYSLKIREERSRTEAHITVRPADRWGCGTVTYECNRGREPGDGWSRMITVPITSVPTPSGTRSSNSRSVWHRATGSREHRRNQDDERPLRASPRAGARSNHDAKSR